MQKLPENVHAKDCFLLKEPSANLYLALHSTAQVYMHGKVLLRGNVYLTAARLARIHLVDCELQNCTVELSRDSAVCIRNCSLTSSYVIAQNRSRMLIEHLRAFDSSFQNCPYISGAESNKFELCDCHLSGGIRLIGSGEMLGEKTSLQPNTNILTYHGYTDEEAAAKLRHLKFEDMALPNPSNYVGEHP